MKDFKMNVPAQIQIWGMFGEDMEELLQIQTQRIGGRFVSYEAHQGLWVFDVDSFV